MTFYNVTTLSNSMNYKTCQLYQINTNIAEQGDLSLRYNFIESTINNTNVVTFNVVL